MSVIEELIRVFLEDKLAAIFTVASLIFLIYVVVAMYLLT